MIHLRLAGGLGNQFFQVGAAVIIAQNTEGPISIWTGAMSNYKTPRELSIDRIVDLSLLNIEICKNPPFLLKARLSKITPGIYGSSCFISDKNISQAEFVTRDIKNVFLDGYFIESIDQNFFEKSVKIIGSALRRSNVIATHTKTCVIHVRGGDFAKLGWLPEDLVDYYRNAIEKVRDVCPNIKFTIVTDDPPFAMSILRDLDEHADVATGSIEADFWLIQSADYAILSNSTFSFWAGAFRLNSKNSWSTIVPNNWRPGIARRINLSSESN